MSEHPRFAVAACTLRKADPGDVDAVTRIWHTGWRDGHIGHVPPGLVPHRTEPQFRPRAQARLDSMWVAESDRGVVGFVTVKGDELEHLYVDRPERGTGVAARLIHRGEAEIASGGYLRAWLAVVAGNRRARAFYARLGWRDAGPFTYMAETGAGTFPVPSHRYEIELESTEDAQDAAIEDNLWSMWSQFGRGPGATLHEDRGALWFETPIPVPPYNMVIRFHVDEGADATIDAIFGRFRARGVPFLWFVHPTARPGDLRQRLEARGFAEVDAITGMAADLRDLPPVPSPPDGVEVRELTSDLDVAPFLEFVAARWNVPDEARAHLASLASTFRIGMPGSPNRAWVALKDGAAIAKVFTHEADGHVGLYGMATRPASRGLGLGRLLCITALTAARQRGQTTAVLHATRLAVPIYERVGFRARQPFSLYAAPASFHA